ncbi:DUF1471 domain-containing protein [Buttiauxella sp. 3AFRM03]|jgi:arginine/ornithine N-succinyltransferase beta subunit|nr:DUF1471 domain-containing protein [Buttiauxella sp. 3AFRM03]TDN53971.1 uncharacterized protein DUF1471 [Buttiauxella sp. JUb87]
MMKNLLYFSVAAVLIALPITTLAVDTLADETSYNQQSGTLTARGSTIEEVENSLKAEAINNGASAYTITTESSDDGQVYGEATLYK